jgi:hydroxymethylglutaryl-CoA lyase
MKLELPKKVTIVEVGPRDGLQNEPEPIDTATKLAFIDALVDAGLTQIEATSFVHPKAIPQLADALDVARALPTGTNATFSALVPNMKGMERAIEAGVQRIALFTAASETFTQKNIRMSIDESFAAFAPVAEAAREHGMSMRGYVSTAFVCPYDGEVERARVLDVTQRLLELGCDEVALSDTIGAAAPRDVFEMVGFVLESVPVERIALHLHDTYGTALANVFAGLQLGITTFDASAGGLGGCPYADGAAGNLATEDLVYLLDRLGIASGVDLERVVAAARIIATALGRDLPGKQFQRLSSAGT